MLVLKRLSFPQSMSQQPAPGWTPCVPTVTREKPSVWPSPLSIRYEGNSRGNWSTFVGTRKVKLNCGIQALFVFYSQNPIWQQTILGNSLITYKQHQLTVISYIMPNNLKGKFKKEQARTAFSSCESFCLRKV